MKYKAVMMEYERGWGSRVDEVIEFDTEAERDKYITDYNTKWNNKKEVPDWYIVATKG